MNVARALKEWETKSGVPAADASEVLLYGGFTIDGKRVFVNKLDSSLAALKQCECVATAAGARDGGRHVARSRHPGECLAAAGSSPSRQTS